MEKLDLSGFISLADDCGRDRNLEAARFSLRLKDGETKLTVRLPSIRTDSSLWFRGDTKSSCHCQGPPCLCIYLVHLFSVSTPTPPPRLFMLFFVYTLKTHPFLIHEAIPSKSLPLFLSCPNILCHRHLIWRHVNSGKDSSMQLWRSVNGNSLSLCQLFQIPFSNLSCGKIDTFSIL